MDQKIKISKNNSIAIVRSFMILLLQRKLIFLFLLFTFTTDISAQKTHKAIFVIADGIPADLIEILKMPNLAALSKQVGFRRAYVGGEKGTYSETPTISAVGYNSLLTGTWVNKHNVWDNDIVAPNYYYWNIYRFFKSQYPEKKTAVFSTWLDNRTKLIGSNAKEAGNIQPDYYFDGMELDTINYPHDTAGYFYNVIDEAVVDTTAAVIKRIAPDLSWVYLEYTDEMGHRHGNGQYLTNAVLMLDKKIGKLWEAIQYREKNFNEEWQVYITTDHGRSENGYDHGGQGERERTTWIATNAKGLNNYFLKGRPAIVDIMPSIASFLQIKIPRARLMEIDGVSLTEKLSAANLQAVLSNDIINLNWEVQDNSGNAKIWLATANKFKSGGEDNYQLIKEVPVAAGKTIINVKKYPSDIYKIVLEMPFNFLNRWILLNK
jgi:predicted AlkP superfamily pyrophosphatase or phosphodiesterase